MSVYANISKLLIGIGLLVSAACQQSTELTSETSQENFFHQTPSSDGLIQDLHTVEVLEHIRGKKYSYLRVSDQGEEVWLATMGGDFEVGTTYHYDEGLEKLGYHSTEFDRTFDRIILVSQMHAVHAHGEAEAPHAEEEITIQPGSMSIAEVVRDARSLAGKQVQITGRVVKVNPNIMDLNWTHIVDGSMDSYDFVLTGQELFPVGHVVTVVGTLAQDRDLGAGYHFDILLENAHTVQ